MRLYEHEIALAADLELRGEVDRDGLVENLTVWLRGLVDITSAFDLYELSTFERKLSDSVMRQWDDGPDEMATAKRDLEYRQMDEDVV